MSLPSVLVYGLRNGLLTVVGRTVDEATPESALRALLDGFTDDESATDIVTMIPAGTELNAVTVKRNEITIDLSAPFDTGGGSLSVMGRATQVVFTATQFPGVDIVRFAIDGKPITTLTSDGFIVDGIGRLDLAENLVPLVLLEYPYEGQKIGQPLHIQGMSNTFEATVYFEVDSPAGTVLLDGFLMATSGTGTWGTFDADLPALPAGTTGPVTLKVFDRSSDTGDPVNVTTVALTLV